MSDTTETEAENTTAETSAEQEAGGNREAAKYRTKLREAEAERDTANERVEVLARQLVDMNLPKHLKPEVFWKVNDSTPTDYLTEEGLNSEMVTEHAEQIAKDLGIADRMARGPVVSSQRGHDHTGSYSGKKGFESAFSPDRDDD